MKKHVLLFSFLFLFGNFIFSQATWSDDVAQIFYDKCAKCHRSGGAGGFSLVTYQEASSLASFLYDQVNTNEMPPWPPDNNYMEYAHDRALTPTEKSWFYLVIWRNSEGDLQILLRLLYSIRGQF